MSHILIIGKNHSVMKQYLASNNISYTVLQDELATKFPDKRFKNRVVCSFKNEAAVIAGLDKIKHPVDGVLCIYENYVLPAAWISSHLNIPGMPVEAAEACTDKELMRMKFDLSPEKISPGFKAVSTEEELVAFANAHDFPLILKPANLAKSLLVTKNDDMSQLLSNYRKANELLFTTYAKYAPNRAPKLIVEEYLEGSIHSVDAFVDANGDPHILENIVDYQTGYDIGFDDNFHYSRLLPSKLSESDSAALRHTADLGCRALGMKSSPAHIEIILTKNGPRIVEIGARNGGYRDRMHAYANGLDLAGNQLDVALSNPIHVTPDRNFGCAVIELFPKNPGTFIGIQNEQALRQMTSLKFLSIKAKPGQFIGKSSDGYKMTAVLMLGSENLDTLSQDLAYVRDNVVVMTDAS